MNKLLPLLAFLLTVLSGHPHSLSADEHSHFCNSQAEKGKNHCFPIFRFQFDPVFVNQETGVGILGEVGPRSYRVNATLTHFANECQRLKLGAEYLGQKLHYGFCRGKPSRWMQQLAIGGVYDWFLDCGGLVKGVEVTGHYVHSQDRSLSCVSFNEHELINYRKLTGACSWELAAGLILQRWSCHTLHVALCYDNTRFHRTYQESSRSSGLGVNLASHLNFCRSYSLDTKLQFKDIYNYFEGLLSWNPDACSGNVKLGLFGNYVWGKKQLPSSGTVGIELAFAFGVDICECKIMQEIDDEGCDGYWYDRRELFNATMIPAVYIPEVLAITDNKICHID